MKFVVDRKTHSTNKKLRKTTEQFIREAVDIHGSRYDYSEVKYTGATNKVTIICSVHGKFDQVASKHINDKCGCPQCGKEGTIKSNKERGENAKGTFKSNTKDFIEKAISIHGNKYSYDKVDYRGVDNKVTITCSEHGDFEQTAYSHLQGNGCRKCADKELSKQRSTNCTTWSYSSWEEAGNASNNFEGFSLYVIECSSRTTGERFIKVGKTFVGVGRRFASRLPYKFKVLLQVYHNAYAISSLEAKIKAMFKEHSYTPTRSFDGQTECLQLAVKDRVIEIADQ